MDLRVLGWTLAAFILPAAATAQITQTNGRYWLPADYNYAFYERYNDAARSFYPAHFAHFRIYEEGLEGQSGLEDRMEAARLRVLDLIEDPPAYEPPFDLVAPEWAKIAHPTGNAMDWTHHLHEQLYDILSAEEVDDREERGKQAISHYLTNLPSAFSTRGYGHAFMMGGGTWAGEFARRFPAMNGILWAYHWHHAAIYEALMEETHEGRQAALENVLTTFTDSVLADLPTYMPLTAQVAPRFSEMFPAAAHIFDNLHMMHDVVNDIMVDGTIPEGAKGAEIDRLLAQMLYRNQDWVVPPMVPADAHGEMPMDAMRIPTQLPDGRWLPQGHPDADLPEGMGHMGHNPGAEGGAS